MFKYTRTPSQAVCIYNYTYIHFPGISYEHTVLAQVDCDAGNVKRNDLSKSDVKPLLMQVGRVLRTQALAHRLVSITPLLTIGVQSPVGLSLLRVHKTCTRNYISVKELQALCLKTCFVQH